MGGRTFYKKAGNFVPLVLQDLVRTKKDREFIRRYCENTLKSDPYSYFSGSDPLRATLEYEDINTFALDNGALIIVFQPYTVAGCTDGPPIVRIPWSDLKSAIDTAHTFYAILDQTLSSRNFIASWNEGCRAEFADSL